MEQKDLMQLKGKLREEYDMICQTEFWKDYIARMGDELKSAISFCVTEPAEKVARYQGSAMAIKTIQGLPSKVLEVTPRKSSQGGQ